MEDAQRLRLLGFGSDLPQAPGVSSWVEFWPGMQLDQKTNEISVDGQNPAPPGMVFQPYK